MLRIASLVCLLVAWSGSHALAQSDWDLYMLRLVNRARADPNGEAARLKSSVKDHASGMGPLAYNDLVAKSAANHNQWMVDNLGKLKDSQLSPDTFSHSETLDGTDGGKPAIGTANFTSVEIGGRLKAAGLNARAGGENIAVNMSTEVRELQLDRKFIETTHKEWWESDAHRHNMLNATFTLFGFATARANIQPETATAARLDHPYSIIVFSTQNFGTLRDNGTFICGLVYEDKDKSGDWTPHDAGASHEGRADVVVSLIDQRSGKKVGDAKTNETGAFSVAARKGAYKLVVSLPGGDQTIENLTVADRNLVVPDIAVPAGK
jgi:uncharacterized protein YkwD